MEIQNLITKNISFSTDTVVDWVDIFSRPRYKHIIVESLEYCQKFKGLVIYAWVLMTNHLHIIAGTENDEIKLSDILRDFKKYTSKKIIETLLDDEQESRREWMLNRFEYAGRNDNKISKYKFWQDNFLQDIYTVDFFNQKLNYLHQNPVRAEFVINAEDYKYSSATDYAGNKGIIKVEVVR